VARNARKLAPRLALRITLQVIFRITPRVAVKVTSRVTPRVTTRIAVREIPPVACRVAVRVALQTTGQVALNIARQFSPRVALQVMCRTAVGTTLGTVPGVTPRASRTASQTATNPRTYHLSLPSARMSPIGIMRRDASGCNAGGPKAAQPRLAYATSCLLYRLPVRTTLRTACACAFLTKYTPDASAAIEAQLLLEKWASRGLDPKVLATVRTQVFNIGAPSDGGR